MQTTPQSASHGENSYELCRTRCPTGRAKTRSRCSRRAAATAGAAPPSRPRWVRSCQDALLLRSGADGMRRPCQDAPGPTGYARMRCPKGRAKTRSLCSRRAVARPALRQLAPATGKALPRRAPTTALPRMRPVATARRCARSRPRPSRGSARQCVASWPHLPRFASSRGRQT